MAYIVLALGVLMALVGLGAMATGYPVIEVERGWATFIAGAVLLSGGVVTAALGIVVRLLLKLAGVARRVPASAPQSEPPIMASPAVKAPIAPAVSAMPVSAASSAAPAFAAAPVAATAAFGGWMAREQMAAPDPVAAPPHDDPEPLPADAYETPEPDEQHSTEDAHAQMGEPEPADEREAATHEAHQTEPEPLSARPQAHAPQSEAWLDQAFQAFDYEMTGNHPPTAEAPAAPPPTPEAEPQEELLHETPHSTWIAEEPSPEPVEPAPHELAHQDLAHQDLAHQDLAHQDLAHHDLAAREASAHEPAAPATHPPAEAEAPATAPEAPSSLAVIGRYDSDGTSYVMYSDGSIEAQSEAGVYRFGSMAELKAFIEG